MRSPSWSNAVAQCTTRWSSIPSFGCIATSLLSTRSCLIRSGESLPRPLTLGRILPLFATQMRAIFRSLILFSLFRATGTTSEVAEILARHLRGAVPFSLSVLYMYDVRHDELVAEHVTGEAGSLVSNLRISRGERLSGWVAANRQTILNSDPMLDLGELSKRTVPPLRTAVSVPLTAENELLGVLTLYSATEQFTDHHRQIVETAGRQAAACLYNLRESIVVRA